MSDAESSTHVDDDELVYRRIPIRPNWYDPDTGVLQRSAFKPTRHDTTGLSVTRGRSTQHPDFLTPEEDAAIGGNPAGYYVAILRVGDLRQCGIDVVATPELPRNPGHAELPQLTYSSRKTSAAIEITEQMAEMLTVRIEGPFIPTPTEEETRTEP